MPCFVLVGRDGPDALARRAECREAHLANLRPLSRSGGVIHGGPLLDEEGQPCGSVVIFEATDLEAARALAARDPYATGGVFASWEVFETRVVFPES